MRDAPPWYQEGLRFACTECGDCCTKPGYVWVSAEERERLAIRLGLDLEEFGRRYLRLVNGRLALTDRADGACIFWDEGCKVYDARPGQCATFPFWKENVATSASWAETADECEGIGDGRVYPVDEVDQLVVGRASTLPVVREKPDGQGAD